MLSLDVDAMDDVDVSDADNGLMIDLLLLVLQVLTLRMPLALKL